MDEPVRELARRDAKAIRGGMVLTLVALVFGVVGLFAGPIAGGLAMLAAAFVQINIVVAWLAGPRFMAERRPLLAPGVLAGIPFAMGAYEVFGAAGAFIASIPAAALVTIVIGMTFAGNRSA
jgi:hypothetical protein